MFDDQMEISSGFAPRQTCDSKYWRQKAQLVIQKARHEEPRKRDRLLKVAIEYEKLALRAEGRLDYREWSVPDGPK